MDELYQGQPRGLTAEEVAYREEAGLTNANTDVHTKTVGQILAEHTFTLFNAVNLIMAILVATTGAWRNMLFMVVVVLNIVIGVFQEIRAKRSVDKLALLAARPVRVRRDGEVVEVSSEGIVIDDVILLAHGDQVPADATCIFGSATVDESLLTGESDAIMKAPGDELLSGSYIISGAIEARVLRVGAEGFAARINAEAKYVKPIRSEILNTLKMVMRWATYGIVPLGVGLFLRTWLMDGGTVQAAILSTVAALVGMIPQGLVLLTSTVLAIATTRLATKGVLVQQSYCVEMLARVDVLCLDKTGTITSGAMELVSATSDEALEAAYAVVSANEADANETARAIIAYAKSHDVPRAESSRAIPFSSASKFSGCVTKEGRALVLGASQFVLGRPLDPDVPRDLLERTLVVAEVEGFTEEGAPTGEPKLLGTVSLRDEIRSSAPETMNYFKDQGVRLIVISGDDPKTVSAIAQQVDVPGAAEWVDATTLIDDEDIYAAAESKTVFGRVTPQQKRQLVRSLKAQGHTVAMTGDGVNDVLALKEADCSISMAQGAAAARNVSEVVLTDNDFSHMPEVVAEGRRSINNLQRSASLFLVKTVYAAALAFVCIFMPPYPFIPIQMTLISAAVIGLPSFVLALEPNHDRVKGNFLANVLARSMPASMAVILALFCALIAGRAMGLSFEKLSTVCTILICLVGIALIVRISWPLTPLRIALLAVVVGIVAVGCTVFAWFFVFAPFSLPLAVLVLTIGIVSLVLFNWHYDRSLHDLAHDGKVTRFIKDLEANNGKGTR